MKTKLFAKTNREVSILGLGCMRLPQTEIDGKWVIDRERALAMVDEAYNSGINYFDTAYMYHDGQSEDFMGEALSRYPRESFMLATKLPIWMADTPKDMERIFNEQLKKLKTDYFDFYLLHSLGRGNWDKCKEFGAYEFVKRKQTEGKIINVGFSFHDSPDVLEEIASAEEWDFAQIQMNYFDWDYQNAKRQYEILESKGIPAIIMEPVRGGALADLGEEANGLLKAAEPNKSIASWAIRFAASKEGVLTVLSGMSNMEQLRDNISTTANFKPLTDAENDMLFKAAKVYSKNLAVPCTGCRYCMDCPMGVDIPKAFVKWNDYAKSLDKWHLCDELNQLRKDKCAPDQCVSCGKCAEHCPQHIDIPTKLAEITEKAFG